MHSTTVSEIKIGGLLKIKVKEGRLFRDTETFGKMDPYCMLEFRDHKFKTRVHKDGGKNPRWGDEFEVRVNDLHEEVKFKIMDEDVGSDDTVGYGIIKISALCINHGVNDWFSIMYENKLAGQILFETRYVEAVTVQKETVYNPMMQQ